MAILEEKLLLILEQTYNLKQDNNPKHTAIATVKWMRTKHIDVRMALSKSRLEH